MKAEKYHLVIDGPMAKYLFTTKMDMALGINIYSKHHHTWEWYRTAVEIDENPARNFEVEFLTQYTGSIPALVEILTFFINAMESAVVQFTPKYDRLAKAYVVAVENGHESFTFEGNEYVTNYAKYLLAYLSDKFEQKG